MNRHNKDCKGESGGYCECGIGYTRTRLDNITRAVF